MNAEAIQEINADEIEQVSGGYATQVFYWVGVYYTIKQLGESAYDVGYWVGSH